MSAKPSLKDLLRTPEARTESLTPPRRPHSHRAAQSSSRPVFEQSIDTNVVSLQLFDCLQAALWPGRAHLSACGSESSHPPNLRETAGS